MIFFAENLFFNQVNGETEDFIAELKMKNDTLLLYLISRRYAIAYIDILSLSFRKYECFFFGKIKATPAFLLTKVRKV